jgi:hypothetical protein
MSIPECINHCTYIPEHETSNVIQWYIHCKTCFPNDKSKGVCLICMPLCHKNHNLSELRKGIFFCDCGKERLCTFGEFQRKSGSDHAVYCSTTSFSSAIAVTKLGRKRKVTSFTNQGKTFLGKKRKRRDFERRSIKVLANKEQGFPQLEKITVKSDVEIEQDNESRVEDDHHDFNDIIDCNSSEDDDEIEFIISSKRTNILAHFPTSAREEMKEQDKEKEEQTDSNNDGEITTAQSPVSNFSQDSTDLLQSEFSKCGLIPLNVDDEDQKGNEKTTAKNEFHDDCEIEDVFISEVSKLF